MEKLYNRFDGIITEYTHLKDNYYVSKNSGIVIDLDRVSFSGKTSKNIIDLIEVGDIVNGKLIHKIDKGSNYCYLYYGNCKTFVDYQIKTILTKEQFEANCYKVGGEDE